MAFILWVSAVNCILADGLCYTYVYFREKLKQKKLMAKKAKQEANNVEGKLNK